jgi:DNA-binding NarL/FixJ family response regulator
VSSTLPSRPRRSREHANGQTGRAANEIRVIIGDDNLIFREGLRGLLTAADFTVVGEAGDGKQVVELTRTQNPDVALIDAQLPDLDALAITRAIKQTQPRVAVVILSETDDEDQLFEAIKAGAAAYYRTDVEPAVLVDGIRRVCAGQYIINESVLTRPLVASRVLIQFRELGGVGQDVERLFIPLSAREIEVLEYISRGNSNKEIARALKISDQTVKNHITSILKKLAVNDRTQAVVYALRKGWIQLNSET